MKPIRLIISFGLLLSFIASGVGITVVRHVCAMATGAAVEPSCPMCEMDHASAISEEQSSCCNNVIRTSVLKMDFELAAKHLPQTLKAVMVLNTTDIPPSAETNLFPYRYESPPPASRSRYLENITLRI